MIGSVPDLAGEMGWGEVEGLEEEEGCSKVGKLCRYVALRGPWDPRRVKPEYPTVVLTAGHEHLAYTHYWFRGYPLVPSGSGRRFKSGVFGTFSACELSPTCGTRGWIDPE